MGWRFDQVKSMQDKAPIVGLPSELSVEEMGLCPFGLDPKGCQLLVSPYLVRQDEGKDGAHAPSGLCMRKEGGIAQIDKDVKFDKESRVLLG